MISPLLTDLYQLTMAYGYWKLNMHEQEAVFELIFRNNPFKGNHAVACGLETVVDFFKNWRFSPSDLEYLATLRAPNKKLLFSKKFLDYLKTLRFSCDVDAVPEGTVVFPQEPLIRVKGPIIQAQIFESTLLNILNFQTLIATKASRVKSAAGDEAVLEFGMRRAQGPDGALSASRAAFVGGCEATSNLLAGKMFGIPVVGTHAHSWVTAFPDELSAFKAYAKVMPHNCVLLVDTFDSIVGVQNAIEIGKILRAEGSELLGVRLDSGDLATLSSKARKMLDKAGFSKTKIIASNSLDEYTIKALHEKGAQISVWGVGTNLVSAYDQPALDGVYKLTAIENQKGKWDYKLKLSEQVDKISNPGIHQVRRYFVNDENVMDIIYDVELGISDIPEMISLDKTQKPITLADFDGCVDLLQPVFRRGKFVYAKETLQEMQERAIQQVKQFANSLGYTVGLEKKLFSLKQTLIKDLKKAVRESKKE